MDLNEDYFNTNGMENLNKNMCSILKKLDTIENRLNNLEKKVNFLSAKNSIFYPNNLIKSLMKQQTI